MREYSSIMDSSRAPRKPCVAFEKLDGSNFRAKYTPKKGFSLYGTRTQLIDSSTPMWGEMVTVFERDLKTPLTRLFRRDRLLSQHQEIIVFGEFLGENSFAGNHTDEHHRIVLFDVLLGHKERKLVLPNDFIDTFKGVVEIPEVIYKGTLSEEFIREVREDPYGMLKEGVICKGVDRSGAYFGNVWMCKIKTNAYRQRLKSVFGVGWGRHWE